MAYKELTSALIALSLSSFRIKFRSYLSPLEIYLYNQYDDPLQIAIIRRANETIWRHSYIVTLQSALKVGKVECLFKHLWDELCGT